MWLSAHIKFLLGQTLPHMKRDLWKSVKLLCGALENRENFSNREKGKFWTTTIWLESINQKESFAEIVTGAELCFAISKVNWKAHQILIFKCASSARNGCKRSTEAFVYQNSIRKKSREEEKVLNFAQHQQEGKEIMKILLCEPCEAKKIANEISFRHSQNTATSTKAVIATRWAAGAHSNSDVMTMNKRKLVMESNKHMLNYIEIIPGEVELPFALSYQILVDSSLFSL